MDEPREFDVDQVPDAELPVTCWRCRKAVPAQAAKCPYCAAELATEARSRPARDENSGLIGVLIGFALMLTVSVLHGIVLHVQAAAHPGVRPDSRQILIQIAIAEIVMTAVVAATAFFVSVPCNRTRRPAKLRAWLLGVLALAVTLAVNVSYYRLLNDQFQVTTLESVLNDGRTALFWWVFAICLQPAVVEEYFFRHLTFDALRANLGAHLAVWVSSVMFAMAHIGNPLGLPVVMLIGVVLGYARWASGGLLLPMVLHFFHNLVVLMLGWQ